MSDLISRYGCQWPADTDPLELEIECIRRGGNWTNSRGEPAGAGLPVHYEAMRKLLWPDLDDHRWNSLCRDEIIGNKVCVLMGPGSSGKTHAAAWTKLCEYYAFPEETLVLISSTDMRSLELRVWGEIKMLHQKAKEGYDWLPGHLIESKHCIATDELSEAQARDLRRGIIGIPTVIGGRRVGLGKWVGVKQKRIRLIADDCQFMSSAFLKAFANLDKNEDFRAIICGNPEDPLDPLGQAAEPLDGWSAHMEPEKTEVWKTRFMNGVCVNLVGTDSPNFDFPDQPAPFPYLISREKIENTLSFFPKDSIEYYSNCKGVMKVAMLSRRVLTRDMCRKFHALEKVIWSGTPRTKITAVDAAYGGDRCVGGHIEFGLAVNNRIILLVHPPEIVPIRIGQEEPEDQIAEWVKDYCEEHEVPPENFFHDATGRGSLGTSLARIWSAMTNPIDFGGSPTERPVTMDMYIWDAKTRQRRLMKCSEHYSKFVTELWFSVRYAVEAEQVRGMPEEVMEEFCMREWRRVSGGRRELETKEEMKERVRRSPDYADWLSIAVEGARRRGFQIAKLSNAAAEEKSRAWFHRLAEEQKQRERNHRLIEV